MTFGYSNFGLNGLTGLTGCELGGCGLMPGGKVEISSTTRGSIFSGIRKNTQITVKNGPDGAWGFLAGLCNTLGGNSAWNMSNWGIPNFNMGMNNWNMGGWNMPNFNLGWNNNSTLTNSAQTIQDKSLSNLKTLGGSNWRIVSNPDGTYTAYNPNKENCSITGDYNTVRNKITDEIEKNSPKKA